MNEMPLFTLKYTASFAKLLSNLAVEKALVIFDILINYFLAD